MLHDVLGAYLDSVSEREFDGALLAILRSIGLRDVHYLHGASEFGKDAIAKRDGLPPAQLVIQSKAGNITMAEWRRLAGQLDQLRRNELAHPQFARDLPREAVLVTTGRLRGAAALAAEDYARDSLKRDGVTFSVWDREQLIEVLSENPHAIPEGAESAGLMESLALVQQRRITDSRLEAYTRAWLRREGFDGWRACIECALLATELRRSERIDLSCAISLQLLRAAWARGTPFDEAASLMANFARASFITHAVEILGQTESALATGDLLGNGFVVQRVTCAKLVETLGLLGLLDASVRERCELAVSPILSEHPAVAKPLSERWAFSLAPGVLLIASSNPELARAVVTTLIKWIADAYEHNGPGLAALEADPDQEIASLLATHLAFIPFDARSHSYAATLAIDLAAALGLADLVDAALNDFEATGATPVVTIRSDDSDRYRVDDPGLKLDTSPKFELSEATWKCARHHDLDIAILPTVAAGLPWDELAVSSAFRIRHDAPLFRYFLESDEPGHAWTGGV